MSDDPRLKEWLDARRKAITASDVAAILGVGYQTPMDVYLDKLGMREVEPTERMRWGLKLQRSILEEYAERMGVAIEFADAYTLHTVPGEPRLGATLDARWAEGDRRPVDAKNVGFKTKEWGEAGTDKIPYQYALQLHVQMMVTGAPCADLAVLFGGNTLVIYHLERDPEIDRIILAATMGFWETHVASGIPPAVDGSSGWRDFLQKHVRQRTPDVRKATYEEEKLIRDLLVARDGQDRAEASVAIIENQLKSAIGTDRGIDSGIAKILWTQATDTQKVDWEAVALSLSALIVQMDPSKGDALDVRRKAHTTVRPGSRRFTITEK